MNQQPIAIQIKRRKWLWIVHTLPYWIHREAGIELEPSGGSKAQSSQKDLEKDN
jgi:hypothetical protein